jgi:hypothetical protein
MRSPIPDLKLRNTLLRKAHTYQAQSYLERGRQLEKFGDAELLDIWVGAFERWFESRSSQTGRKMDDVATEIRLRELGIPYHRVKLKIEQLTKKVRFYDPKFLNEKIQSGFRVADNKPQN